MSGAIDTVEEMSDEVTALTNKTQNLSADGSTFTGNATKDGNGNVIASTYASAADLNSLDSTVSALSQAMQTHFDAIGDKVTNLSADGSTFSGNALKDGNGNTIATTYATKQEVDEIDVASVTEENNTSTIYRLRVTNRDGSYFITPNLIGGSSTVTEITIFDTTNCPTVGAVQAALDPFMKTSNDGLATWNTIIPYDYHNMGIGSYYDSNYGGGLNWGGVGANGTYPMGAYSISPITLSGYHNLVNLKFYNSNWINPSFNLHLIEANSVSDIPTKIANQDYAYSQTIIMPALENDNDLYVEALNIAAGTYYVFIEFPTNHQGNEAILKKVKILNY